MTTKTYKLEFDGYWSEPNISGLPAKSGIYCVYGCTYNATSKTVSIKRLIYIGEAENIQTRVANHEKWDQWRRYLKTGEQLCFNAALISGNTDRQRAEAAMIFKHKPPCNTEYVNSFPFDQTTIHTSGRNALLYPYFKVFRTPASSGLSTLSHY